MFVNFRIRILYSHRNMILRLYILYLRRIISKSIYFILKIFKVSEILFTDYLKENQYNKVNNSNKTEYLINRKNFQKNVNSLLNKFVY